MEYQEDPEFLHEKGRKKTKDTFEMRVDDIGVRNIAIDLIKRLFFSNEDHTDSDNESANEEQVEANLSLKQQFLSPNCDQV